MAGKIFVRPKPGIVLRHLSQHRSAKPLPPQGGWWPNDQFTHRRILDGGIELAEPPKPETAESQPAPTQT